MSDNIDVTPGSGKTIAADEVGAVLYQRVKIGVGVQDVVPTDLAFGAAAAASSLPVTQSTEDVARMGSVTETAPSNDTASSGLNGRLQRVAQRLTSVLSGIGSISDTSWTSGDGSVISVLKALASDTTAADVNLTKIGGTTLSAAAPVPVQLSQGGAVLAASNPVPTQLSQGAAALSETNYIWARRPRATPVKVGLVNTTSGTSSSGKNLASAAACVLDSLSVSSQETVSKVWLQIYDAASEAAVTPGAAIKWEMDFAFGEKLIMADLNLKLTAGCVFFCATAQGGSTKATLGVNVNAGFN